MRIVSNIETMSEMMRHSCFRPMFIVGSMIFLLGMMLMMSSSVNLL